MKSDLENKFEEIFQITHQVKGIKSSSAAKSSCNTTGRTRYKILITQTVLYLEPANRKPQRILTAVVSNFTSHPIPAVIAQRK